MWNIYRIRNYASTTFINISFYGGLGMRDRRELLKVSEIDGNYIVRAPWDNKRDSYEKYKMILEIRVAQHKASKIEM